MAKKNLKNILSAYHKGDITQEDKALVENWLAFGKHEATELTEREVEQDLLTIDVGLPIVKPRPVMVLWSRLAAAAVILLLLSFGGAYYAGWGIFRTSQNVYVNDIAPGGNKAVLTLANGQKISLTDAKDGELASQAGVIIKKKANGQITYTIAGRGGANRLAAEYNTIDVPMGGQYQVDLPDGTKIWLDAQSSFRYPVNFTGKERKVEVTGEAYFEVAHNKSMPFKVKSAGQIVEVLGTHFNVMAYPGEKLIKTTLLEGSVKISNATSEQVIAPGQQAQVSSSAIKVVDADVEDAVAWKNGYFKFHENLEGIMNKIARWYNVEIIYEETPDSIQEFGGEISRGKNISAVLNIIEKTSNIHFKVEGRRVIVKK
jgi:transmembrane sensor